MLLSGHSIMESDAVGVASVLELASIFLIPRFVTSGLLKPSFSEDNVEEPIVILSSNDKASVLSSPNTFETRLASAVAKHVETVTDSASALFEDGIWSLKS